MNLDIPETLLDVANAKIPVDMQGASMLGILKGEKDTSWRRYVYYHYYESGGEHNVAKHVGVRSDRYKLIYFYENNEWELYDLKNDPSELHNIYNVSSYKKIQDILKNELHKQMQKYRDTI
jgi:arylsulfatase A-like enzyme